MTDTATPPPTVPENGAGSTPDKTAPDPTQEQQARLQACMRELQSLLERHRCQIVPGFAPPLPVGVVGDTVQIQSRWNLGTLPPE